MRSKGSRGKSEASEKQLAQQLKFALVMHFLQPMAGLLYISFRNFAIKMTGMNSAFAYLIQNAVKGVYPSFTIDYSLALVSRGDLPNVPGPAVTVGAKSILTFSWTDNSVVGSAKATDQAIPVAYCPGLKQFVYSTLGGMRNEVTGDLDLSSFSGDVVETWIGFMSADGRSVATSIFTGEVTVS